MKAIIFDSGPLINLSLNGLLSTLEKIRAQRKIKLLITEEVKKEICDVPSRIPQFELSAIKMADLIKNNILEYPESVGISKEIVSKKTRSFTEEANYCMEAEGNKIFLVSEAEMSCLALADEMRKQGHEVILAIDERTARMLCEKPENLERLMSNRLHKKVRLTSKLENFKGFRIIRSSELVYAAYKRGFIGLSSPNSIEALLYATKFKGSSISWEEIATLKKL